METKNRCSCGACSECSQRKARQKWNAANADREKERKHRRYLENQEQEKEKARIGYLIRKALGLIKRPAQRKRAKVIYANFSPERKEKERAAALRRYRVRYQNNKEAELEKFRLNQAKRNAAKQKSGGVITVREWLDLKKKYDYTCLCCKRKEPEIKLTLDHVKSLKLGGANVISNAQPLCISCNSSKGAKWIDYR